MMKYLKAAFIHIPDQVLSTIVLWGFGYVFYRGFISIIAEPPTAQIGLVVILIGVILGLITARVQSTLLNEKNTETPPLDK